MVREENLVLQGWSPLALEQVEKELVEERTAIEEERDRCAFH